MDKLPTKDANFYRNIKISNICHGDIYENTNCYRRFNVINILHLLR